MRNQILALTVKELKVIARDRGALIFLFLLPIAFILVMTTALQGVFTTGSSDNPVHILVVNQDQGDLAASVINDLHSVSGLHVIEQNDGRPLTRPTAEALITAGKFSLALIFPDDFSSSILAAASDPDSPASTVAFVTDPTVGSQLLDPVKGMVQGYVARAAMLAQAPQQMRNGFDGMAAQFSPEQAAFVRALGDQFTTNFQAGLDDYTARTGVTYQVVSPADYHVVEMPTSAQQNVPGYTIYGVFFIVQTIALSLFREKNEGTFRRLQAAPLSQAALLTGKLLPYFLVNLIQIVLMFAIGVVVFHIGLGNDWLALILLSLASAAAATGLGLLLASLTRTQEQAGSLGALLAILLSAVGGSMVPVSVMPGFMQTLSKFTPTAWALNGFLDVMVRGLGVAAILPGVGMLMAFTAVFWAIALWRFRFE